jgi:carbonic anhydrase
MYGDLPITPSRKLAVLACMDARLTIEDFLGLSTGDSHIIRNAGGIATDDDTFTHHWNIVTINAQQ